LKPSRESSWSDRRVLVTGGTGFIGGRLAERLVREKGALVRVLARSREKAARLSARGFEVILGDMTDRRALKEAVSGCEMVFHCAHAFGLGMEEAVRVNVGGTRDLLEASGGAGVSRFIYLSSVAVYGQRPPDGADEGLQLGPTGDPYADSKIAAEKEVFSFGRRWGLEVVVLRPAIVYGPGSRIWSLGIVRALQARHPIVVGSGEGTCNTLFVDNLVDAIFLAGENGNAAGQAFIITDGRPCTWGEFVGRYARMLGIESAPSCPKPLAIAVAELFRPVDFLRQRLQDTPSWEPGGFLVMAVRKSLDILREAGFRICAFTPRDIRYFTHRATFDIRKAGEVLGYRPRVGLDEGMEMTEAWLREEGVL